MSLVAVARCAARFLQRNRADGRFEALRHAPHVRNILDRRRLPGIQAQAVRAPRATYSRRRKEAIVAASVNCIRRPPKRRPYGFFGRIARRRPSILHIGPIPVPIASDADSHGRHALLPRDYYVGKLQVNCNLCVCQRGDFSQHEGVFRLTCAAADASLCERAGRADPSCEPASSGGAIFILRGSRLPSSSFAPASRMPRVSGY